MVGVVVVAVVEVEIVVDVAEKVADEAGVVGAVEEGEESLVIVTLKRKLLMGERNKEARRESEPWSQMADLMLECGVMLHRLLFKAQRRSRLMHPPHSNTVCIMYIWPVLILLYKCLFGCALRIDTTLTVLLSRAHCCITCIFLLC